MKIKVWGYKAVFLYFCYSKVFLRKQFSIILLRHFVRIFLTWIFAAIHVASATLKISMLVLLGPFFCLAIIFSISSKFPLDKSELSLKMSTKELVYRF